MKHWPFNMLVIICIAGVPPLISGENKWERYKAIKLDSLICVVADPHEEMSFYGWHLRKGFVKRTSKHDWQTISLNNFPLSLRPNKIVPNPYRPKEVYSCTNAGLYRSVDGGETWFELNLAQFEVFACAIASSSNMLYTVTDRGVFRRVTNGETWEPIPGKSLNFKEVRSMVVSKNHHQHLYLGSLNGITKYEATDSLRRLTDHEQFSPLNSIVDLINAPHHAEVLFAISDSAGVFWAEDGKKVYWREMNQNLVKPFPRFISAVLTRSRQQLQISALDSYGRLWRYKFLIPSVVVFDPKSENLAPWQRAEISDMSISALEGSYRIKSFSLHEFKSYPEDRLREIAQSSGCDAAFYQSIDPNSSILTRIFFFHSDKARSRTLQETCTPENFQTKLRKTLKDVRNEINQELGGKNASFSDFLFKNKYRWLVWPILSCGAGTLVTVLTDDDKEILSTPKRLPSPPPFPGTY